MQVNRLAVKRDASSSFTVPPLPEIPDYVRTVSDFKNWWRSTMPTWLSTFHAHLKAQLDDLRAEDSP